MWACTTGSHLSYRNFSPHSHWCMESLDERERGRGILEPGGLAFRGFISEMRAHQLFSKCSVLEEKI